VFDTFCMTLGIEPEFVPSQDVADISYSSEPPSRQGSQGWIYHQPLALGFHDHEDVVPVSHGADEFPAVFADKNGEVCGPLRCSVDLVANSFFFLSGGHEPRIEAEDGGGRALYESSFFSKYDFPMDAVDVYREEFKQLITRMWKQRGTDWAPLSIWPDGHSFALTPTHDVDFIPLTKFDVLKKGAITVARHAVRHRSPGDAVRSGSQFAYSLLRLRNPYRAIPRMLEREEELGIGASYQVQSTPTHGVDVKYRIDDPEIREYLSQIPRRGFDLCLHGSYTSAFDEQRFSQEVDNFANAFGRPLGNRQHYLSFDYHSLYRTIERTGIQFDMSLGYPDMIGFRSAFSFAFFPYDRSSERPFDVLEIPLFAMDVTLRTYMGLQLRAAWKRTEPLLEQISAAGGAGSICWHPIIFGGARDPGYDTLFWMIVERAKELGGYVVAASDINSHIRQISSKYSSFSELGR